MWPKNGERFKPNFAERDKKHAEFLLQTMTDLRGVSTYWFKTCYVPQLVFLGYVIWTNSVLSLTIVLSLNVLYPHRLFLAFSELAKFAPPAKRSVG